MALMGIHLGLVFICLQFPVLLPIQALGERKTIVHTSYECKTDHERLGFPN